MTFKRHWDPTPQTKLWMVYLKQDITHKLTDKSLLGSKASITLYLMQLRIIKHKHDERLIKLMKYKSDFEKEGRNISIHEDILPYYMLCKGYVRSTLLGFYKYPSSGWPISKYYQIHQNVTIQKSKCTYLNNIILKVHSSFNINITVTGDDDTQLCNGVNKVHHPVSLWCKSSISLYSISDSLTKSCTNIGRCLILLDILSYMY